MSPLLKVLLWLALPVAVCVWAVAHGQLSPARPNVPGAVLTDDVRKICQPGYSASVRPPESVTEPYKLMLLRRLPADVSHDPGDYELDDREPICAGGKPGPDNWWLQPIEEARAKDREEAAICREVCAGRIDIHDAQKYFLNWPDGTLQ